MLSTLPRLGSSRCCISFVLPLLLLALLVIAPPVLATSFSAHSLGDFQQVAVVEISGNFDALDPFGRPNTEPRRAVAREFYRTHGDDYDFLVIFTGFDVRMPTLQAKAFFSPVRNNVRGIGLPLYDNSPLYSPHGAVLQHLEGTIDMGNLAAHVLEPTDPRFETTMRVLTHEMLHRWGAYVRFLDAGVGSEALLGIDRAHWSFLLDSGGSTLYGNRWQDNHDGTFTALTPESAHPGELFGRLLTPLELYLMGFAGAEQVPPLTLIDSPGLDPAKLPAPGVTIPGMARSVSIEEIIAAEGPRLPSSSESRKELRMAFVLAVEPGSFAAEEPAAAAQLAAIGRLRGEWERRFAILTGGVGAMRTQLASDKLLSNNPSLPVASGSPTAEPRIDAGVAWLIAQQQADGRWQEQGGTALRDTAAAIRALTPFPVAATAVARGRGWLQQTAAVSHDFLARRLAAGVGAEHAQLTAWVNADGGWGGAAGFRSTPLDTALVLQALTAAGEAGASVDAACTYLHALQQADGGWSAGIGASQLLPTCIAMAALEPWRTRLPLEAPIAEARYWLESSQNSDGGFGHPGSHPIDTALALLALKSNGHSTIAVTSSIAWLLANQAVGGSWQGSQFATALAVQALYAAQMAPDLAVAASDISFTPPMLETLPGEVVISAVLRNPGGEAVTSAGVALYAGDPLTGGVLVGKQQLEVAGHAATSVSFTVPIDVAGVHPFYVVADPDGEVAESDEWNNSAGKSLVASLPPPTVGFAEAVSSVAEGAGELAVRVNLSHPWHEAVTIRYAVGEGSSAVAGSDYRPLIGTLTIPAGESVSYILLQLIDDQVAEADKELLIEFAPPPLGTLGRRQHRVMLLDDELPAITIISPRDGVVGEAGPLLLFSTTAATVQVRVDGELVSIASGEQLAPLLDGDHFLEVLATSGLGLTGSRRVDFRIDTSLPKIAIQSPTPGNGNDPAPRLIYTVDGAAAYHFDLDGRPLTRASGERLDPLADGVHLLTMTAWNTAGAKVSAEVQFVVDTVPPDLAIIYPNGDVLRETAPTLFCAVDESAIVTVWVDGAEVTTRCGERLETLVDGAHRIEMTARDSAGNQTTVTADFLIFTGSESAYPTAPGWPISAARSYGGLAVDPMGNVYLATQDAGYTLMIRKYTSRGVLVWQLRPFAFVINPQDLAVDAAGNLFVVGYDGSGDGFVYKFAAVDGAYLAGHTFRTAGSDYALAVQVTDDGQILVAGDTGGNLYGPANGTMNVWIARLDSDCRLLAGRQLTRSGRQELAGRGALSLDRAGNAYLAGYTDAATFGTGHGGDDAFVVKFDRGLWPIAPALQFGTNGNDRALDVVVDIYGNIYVSGVSETPVNYFTSGFLYKFDAAGNSLRHIDVGSRPLQSLACDRDGTLYAVDGSGTVGKYASDLQLLWNRSLAWNYRYQLARDRFGDLYAAGDAGTSGGYASVIKLADSRRPAVTLDVAQLQVNRDTVEFSGTLTAGATIELATASLQRLGAVVYPQTGRWQMSVTGLALGDNSVVLQATGPGGFSRQVQALVTVDVNPPVVVISSPVEGHTYSEKPLLTYTVSDGRPDVEVNGVALFKSSGQLLDALQPGWNLVRVAATDLAGNIGSATVRIFAQGAATGELPLSQVAFVQTGTAGNETVVAAAGDSDGNLYLLGHTTGNFPGQVNAGGRDPFVSKFDAAGRYLTTWQFGLPGDETAVGLVIDSSGNLYVAWNVQYLNNKGEPDFAVRLAKLTGSGVVLWQTELNSTAKDLVHALTLDRNGDVLLAGETYGSLDKQRYGGAGDYFLARFSATGSRQWVRLSNEATAESLVAMAVDAAGNLYGAAYVGSSLGGVAVPEHVALLKFDAGGSLLKVELLPLPGGDYTVRVLRHDAAGRILTAGSNGKRYFLAAYDGALNRQWLVLSDAVDSLDLRAMLVDAAGNLFVAGQATTAFAGNRAIGGSDGVVVKHAPTGERSWSLQYGSNGNDYVGGMVMGGGGELWVGGHSDGLLGASRAGLSDLYLAGLTQPELPRGPRLSIDPYPELINTTTLELTGTTSIDAALTVEAHTSMRLAPLQVSSDGVWTLTIEELLPDTSHSLTITASNPLGTTSLGVAVIVDDRPPLLTVEPPLSPTMLTTQLLRGTAESGASLRVTTARGSFQVESLGESGCWNYLLAGLEGGDNEITVTATDAAGNVTSRCVVIDYVPPPPPTLTVEPRMISAREATDIVITIGQVSPPGETLVVTQVLDLDGDSHAGDQEPVVRRFSVTDGLQSDNPHLPGDEDGAVNGVVSVRLNGHFVNDRHHAAGESLFVVTTTGGSAVAGFTVLADPQPQSLTGTVRDTLGVPIGGALVEVTDRWGHSHGFAVSDCLGRYSLYLGQPGEFRLWPTAAGYGFSLSDQTVVLLSAGQTMTRDLVMVAGAHTLTGRVFDAVSTAGVAGVTVRAENDHYLAAAMTDVAGGYAMSLPAGSYRLSVAGDSVDGLAGPGYLSTRPVADQSLVAAGSSGNDLAVVPATGSICGRVKTSSGAAVAGVPMRIDHGSSGLLSQGLSDEQGDFCVGTAGSSVWEVAIPDRLALASGWLGTPGTSDTTADVTVYPLDSRVAGIVTDADGRPLARVPLVARHAVGAVMTGSTADDGSYRLGISSEPSGLWSVLASGETLGFLPTAAVAVSAAPGAVAAADFILRPPALANTIVVTRASYDARKQLLTVEATSHHQNAQLQVDGYWAMTFVKLFKGKYYWSLTRSAAVKPATVTVSGPEGSVAAAVP